LKRRHANPDPVAPALDRHATPHLLIAAALGLIVVVLHALGTFLLPDALWGSHCYAFLPRGVWLVALALLVHVVAVVLFGLRGPSPASTPVRLGRRRPFAARALASLGIAVGAFALLWGARSRQLLLGDGLPLTAQLPFDRSIHAHEPLTSLVQQQAYRIVQAAQTGRNMHDVSRDAVAFGSTLAGVLFAFVAYGLGLELLRLRPGPEGQVRAPRLAVGVAIVFCVQGAVQLFFGYVENYAYDALAVALYIWAALRYLRSASPLALPAACLLLAVALDLASALLAPSFVLLGIVGLRRRERRLPALRDLMIAVLLAAAAGFALYAWGGRYRIDSELLAMARRGAAQAGYMFSRGHVRDFMAEQFLIGPFALAWCVPAGLYALFTRAPRRAALGFLGFAAAVQALLFWGAADLPLGYARDWDLFAPFATVFVAFALASFLVQVPESRAVWRVLVVVIAVSLFHTAPWIAVNASPTRSLERFKHLPLGRGRTEATVGFWYFSEGRLDEARGWLERALLADPDNVRAYAHLGGIELTSGHYDLAAQAFAEAVARRPNQPLFRESLVTALLAQNRIPEALEQLRVLIALEPERPRHWALAGVLLQGIGHPDDARQAMQRAAMLAPDDSLYVLALQMMERPGAYDALMANTLPGLLER